MLASKPAGDYIWGGGTRRFADAVVDPWGYGRSPERGCVYMRADLRLLCCSPPDAEVDFGVRVMNVWAEMGSGIRRRIVV